VKLNARIGGNFSARAARDLAERVPQRLQQELEEELQSVSASGQAADPETRRDALERAVRRVWGAPL
jgi:hypothetical protein